MKLTISTLAPVNFALCETDEQKSIAQNVALILKTKQGTVPMYRGFGMPMDFVGRPMNVAETVAVSEAYDAIAEFEPRAKVTDIRAVSDPVTGELALEVDVNI